MNVRPGDIISLEAFVPCWTFWKEHLRREDPWHPVAPSCSEGNSERYCIFSSGWMVNSRSVFRYSTLDESYGIIDTQDMPFASCMSLVCLVSLICGFALVMNASGPVVASKTQLLNPGYVVKKELPASITACDWGVQISTACFEVSRHPCFFLSVWAHDPIGFKPLGKTVGFMDDHGGSSNFDGLLGGKTKSLQDSSLDK